MKDIVKQEWKDNWWLRFLTLTSITLIIAGFIVPPIGEISGSLLTAIGEIEGFGALTIVDTAVRKGTKVKATKGNSSLEVGAKKEE